MKTTSVVLLSVLALTSCAGMQKMFAAGKKFDKAQATKLAKSNSSKDKIVAELGDPQTHTKEKNAAGAEYDCHSWYFNGLSPMAVGNKTADGSISTEPRLHACFDAKGKSAMFEVDGRITGDISLWSDAYNRKYKAVGGQPFYLADSNVEIDYFPNILAAGQLLRIKNKTNKVVNINWANSSLRLNSRQMELAPASFPRTNWDRPAPATQVLPGEEFYEFVYAKPLYTMVNYALVQLPLCGEIKGYQKNGTPVINDRGCEGTKITGVINYSFDSAAPQTVHYTYELAKARGF